MGANTISSHNEELVDSENEKEATLENLENTSKISDYINTYHTTSCGVSAVKCQSGWSGIRMMEWAYALEANYC